MSIILRANDTLCCVLHCTHDRDGWQNGELVKSEEQGGRKLLPPCPFHGTFSIARWI